MNAQLRQALRTLCFNTEWKYAIFWKIKHQGRTMLTWEDAYYDNVEQLDFLNKMCFAGVGGNMHNWHSHDPIGLAVAKMPYHKYSLGEGVIGQVAVTGKHMWIFADKQINDLCSPFEHCDGWRAQFSAGIMTVVVVAVVPYGVIQLGSLNKIPEDLKMVNHVRDAFFALQDSSVAHTPIELHCTVKGFSCLSDISTSSSDSGVFHNWTSSLGRSASNEKIIIQTPSVSSNEKPAEHSYNYPLPSTFPEKTADATNKVGGLELSELGGDGSSNLLQSVSEGFLLEQQKQVSKTLHIDRRFEGETSGLEYLGLVSDNHDTQSSNNSFKINNLYNGTLPTDSSRVDITCLQADLLDLAVCNDQNGILHVPEPFCMQIQRDLEKNVEFQAEINTMEPFNLPFKFSAGYELSEILGPAFRKQSICNWEAERTETEIAIDIPEGMVNSYLLTADSASEHLLEAVVADVCRGETDVKSEKSFSESVKSQLTTEKIPQPTCEKLTVATSSYSFDQSLVEKETLRCSSSEVCGDSFSKGFSSRSCGTFSGQFDSAQEPSKICKKRARPGENCRPRPRDRQLIQDRIKELRELVPNGSKCSIDSLLERTIKHMLFMQSITKHAEKLNNCIDSKFSGKEPVVRCFSSFDQGSTWAVEVGSHLKVHSIMIENVNMNGQMLIEMLCKDSSHFLEMAEAVRCLGLTILKGATEACGKKNWVRFLVEGRNNRCMHRMDVLWSLVQILQSKATI